MCVRVQVKRLSTRTVEFYYRLTNASNATCEYYLKKIEFFRENILKDEKVCLSLCSRKWAVNGTDRAEGVENFRQILRK